jgi:hypothetical protein
MSVRFGREGLLLFAAALVALVALRGSRHVHVGPPVAAGALAVLVALGDVRLSNALGTIVLVVAVWAMARRSPSPVARIGAPLAVAVMPFTLGVIIETWSTSS